MSTTIDTTELSSSHVLLYHIKFLARDWSFTNPYFQSLRALFFNSEQIHLTNLRTQQLFHFLAKIIVDEIKEDKSKIKNNIDQINQLIEAFSINKRTDDGEKVLRSVYIINILRLLNRKLHHNAVQSDLVKTFLENIIPVNNTSLNMRIILCFLYSMEQNDELNIDDDYDLVLSLLYDKLQLSRPDKRNEKILIDYYVKQKELEQKDYSRIVSESSKGRVLEIAIVLEAIVGKGLYLPDLEKEQYLSTYANTIIISKYNSIINKMHEFELYNVKISLWLLNILFYALEVIIFLMPQATNSITIPLIGIEVNLEFIRKLSISHVLLFNAIITGTFLYYVVSRTKRQIKDKKW